MLTKNQKKAFLSVRLSVCPSVRLSVCPSHRQMFTRQFRFKMPHAYQKPKKAFFPTLLGAPSLCPSVCLSVCLSVCPQKNVWKSIQLVRQNAKCLLDFSDLINKKKIFGFAQLHFFFLSFTSFPTWPLTL